MSFSVTHISGAMDQDPAVSALISLVEELAEADSEHPDVAVAHESGWTLSGHQDGRVVWENVETNAEPRHLEGVDREKLVALFAALASGDVGTIEAEEWMPGY